MDGYWTDTFGDWIFVSWLAGQVANLVKVIDEKAREETEDIPWDMMDKAHDLWLIVDERDFLYSCRLNEG